MLFAAGTATHDICDSKLHSSLMIRTEDIHECVVCAHAWYQR